MTAVAMKHRAVIGGERVFLSEHAIERYIERVLPTLTRSLAIAELGQVLRHANVHDRPPEFCREVPVDGGARPSRWVVLADSIVFPVERDCLVTCITPDAVSDETSSSGPARPEPDALVRQGLFGYPSPEGQKKRKAIARRHAERDIRRELRRRRWRCFWSWPWGHRYETPDGRGTTEVFATASSGGARPDLRCVGCGRGFGVGNA